MQKLSKDGELSQTALHLKEREQNAAIEEQTLLPLEEFSSALDNNIAGVWLDTDADIDKLDPYITNLKCIAIRFPAFTDGRGFSLASTLRNEKGFSGQLIAAGEFIQDQLFYLRRCGFDSFLFEQQLSQQQLESMRGSLNDFSEVYQPAIEQPLPLFKRRVV